MDHICVTYMIIYVCRHMMHIYDPALKSYVVSPCDVRYMYIMYYVELIVM